MADFRKLVLLLLVLFVPVIASAQSFDHWAAIGVTLQPDPALRPALSVAAKVTDRAGGLYSISDYTVVGMSRRPLSMQIVSMTGVANPIMRVGPEKWKVRLWGVAQVGLAQSSDATGFAFAPGVFATVPIRDWLMVVPGVKPVKTTLSDWQAEYRVSVAFGW
jgi:hypothetical protein